MELSSSQLQQRNRTTVSGILLPLKALKVILYSAVVLLLAATLAWLFVAMQKKIVSIMSGRIVFSLSFWVIGLAHIFIYHPLLALLQRKVGLLFSLLLSIFVGITAWIIFAVLGIEDLSLVAIAAVSFLLPHVLQQLVFNLMGISAAKGNGWVIPAGAEPDRRMSLLLNSMHFKISIKATELDANPFLFSVNLPERLQLSKVFLRFLYDRQNEVDIIDQEKKDYEWNFWTLRRLGFKKILDANKTLVENGVKEDDIIFIERVILG